MSNHPNRSTRNPANAYMVSDGDWRSGRVTITKPDGSSVRLTVAELSHAAHQPDRDLASIYRHLWERANEELAANRAEEIHRCPEHHAERSKEVCFSGSVSRDENPAAHGNICRIDYCRCGAERRTNINGCHVEQGSWS